VYQSVSLTGLAEPEEYQVNLYIPASPKLTVMAIFCGAGPTLVYRSWGAAGGFRFIFWSSRKRN